MPLFQGPGNGVEHWVQSLGNHVLGGIRALFWFVVAVAAIAASYVALRAIWWAVQVSTRALGI
jgi:hypothetical protein